MYVPTITPLDNRTLAYWLLAAERNGQCCG